MLITFKGKGCTLCPFVQVIQMACHTEICELGATTPNRYNLPLLLYNEKKKPDGCPFKNGEKIEVIAVESE